MSEKFGLASSAGKLSLLFADPNRRCPVFHAGCTPSSNRCFRAESHTVFRRIAPISDCSTVLIHDREDKSQFFFLRRVRLKVQGRTMNARISASKLLGLVVLTGFTGIQISAAPPVPWEVKWHKNVYTAHAESMRTKKPLLIVFRANWCAYCRKLEQKTLADSRVAQYVGTSFVPVSLDLDRDQRIARILEVKSVPTTIILSHRADLLGKLVGYVEGQRFHSALQSAHRLGMQVERTWYSASRAERQPK